MRARSRQRPDERLAVANFVGLAVKDSQVEHEHQKNEDAEAEPEHWRNYIP
jgi:hypothetical protein